MVLTPRPKFWSPDHEKLVQKGQKLVQRMSDYVRLCHELKRIQRISTWVSWYFHVILWVYCMGWKSVKRSCVFHIKQALNLLGLWDLMEIVFFVFCTFWWNVSIFKNVLQIAIQKHVFSGLGVNQGDVWCFLVIFEWGFTHIMMDFDQKCSKSVIFWSFLGCFLEKSLLP